ncbi:MAG: sulfotransferase [Cyanobacteria bacterium J06598_1]
MGRDLSNQPIFIVGAPRSGTTLLSAFLAGHPRIACGPETQFFSKLELRQLNAAVRDRDWPSKGVELLKSLTLSGESVCQLYGLDTGTITAYLRQHPPSIAALLEALTVLHAQKSEKPRWAEKTPNHLLHLRSLQSAFPKAIILRIVRDPRDSALSMRKLPWASQSVLANCYLWDEWFRRSHWFFAKNEQALTIRYEDLLARPTELLRQVCEHVGESFEPGMLNTAKAAASVAPSNEPWKRQVSQPLDPSRAYVWKHELPQSLWPATSHICQAGIKAFGYELTSEPDKTVFVYALNRRFIEANTSLLVSAAEGRMHLSPVQAETLTDGKRYSDLMFCDLPDCGQTKGQRLVGACLFVMMLIRRRLRGNANSYLPFCLSTDKSVKVGTDRSVCAFFLKLLGKKTEFSLENSPLEVSS